MMDGLAGMWFPRIVWRYSVGQGLWVALSKLERQAHSWSVLPVTPWKVVVAVPLSAVDTTATGRCHDVRSRSRRFGCGSHVDSKKHCDR